jgi:hypothetical protein
MYGHFHTFAQFDEQRRQLWESVLSATQAVANQVQRSSSSAIHDTLPDTSPASEPTPVLCVRGSHRDHSSRTGLLPDFVQFDRGCGSYKPAQPGFLEGNNDGSYFYNAGRIPWRFGTLPAVVSAR